ncbi:NPL4 family-domain-containing protein [Lentinula detonsa]|uniref:Nuclear protein localization protein 4 n=1 Tax=Lentinula detonsa TaxID=2804962 RepID=A0AA38PQZ8_9AGAR|nr:NPL4 family-domain-containing protein [Lentinula detonsa]
MLIRIRSKDGNFRHELDSNADALVLLRKISEHSPNIDEDTVTISNQPRGAETKLSSLKGRTLKSLGLRFVVTSLRQHKLIYFRSHGDLVFVQYKEKSTGPSIQEPPSSSQAVSSTSTDATHRPWDLVQEDPVDVYWRSKDGKIPRQRDPQFCKHGPKGMCDYCMPLEPYDVAYHKEHGIKHLSYHAYLQKVAPKSSGATQFIPPLNPLDYRVKVPCPTGNHPSWPSGICTSCQPSAITLQSQPFRMVDHLEIASTDVIDRFLQAWRRTGMQRFGWMIGRYEPYDKVPMGVKAVVEAIHEPPQEGELDGLTLGLPWEDEPRIRNLASQSSTPMTIVGYIFTDLDPREEDRTKNVYKRHPSSFLMSSLEAIFAAAMQAANPTPSKSSSSGKFSSRLVTAILTGTEDGAIDMSAYQVSEQATAMVEADMIEASVDPGIVRVKEEDRSVDSARYVPDVFFSYKNEYGLEVKKSAKPAFPVEYLMINVTHGFPQNPVPVFQSTQFFIENRLIEHQTVERVLSQLSVLGAPDIPDSRHRKPGDAQKAFELAKFLSDWHLVAFLDTTQLFPPNDMKVLMKAATSPTIMSDASQLDPLIATDGWQTLMTFTRENAPAQQGSALGSVMDEDIPQDILDQIAAEQAAAGGSGPASGAASGAATPGIKTCPHCTFENDAASTDCEVCGLPLS